MRGKHSAAPARVQEALLGLFGSSDPEVRHAALRSLEINAQHVALMRSFRAAATSQLEAGRGSAQDVLQAEAELTYMERDAVILAADALHNMLTVSRMDGLDPYVQRTIDRRIGGHAAEPDLGRLQTRAQQLGLTGRLEFTGFQPPAAVAGSLRAADVLVLPNRAVLTPAPPDPTTRAPQ